MINKRTISINAFSGLLCILSVILDQASKLFAINHLTPHTPFNILPFFNFTLTFNKGISFSMLSEYDSSLLIILACFCLGLLFIAYKQFNSSMERILLSLIIGGAIGNLIDRIAYGAVIDFIDIFLPSNVLHNGYEIHFPAFNMADTFITTGVVGMVLYNLFRK